MQQIMKNTARVLVAGATMFELAGGLGLLHRQPDFTWLGLVLTAVLAFSTLEVVAYVIRKKTGRRLHWLAYWALLIPLFIDALGDILHGYSTYMYYDRLRILPVVSAGRW